MSNNEIVFVTGNANKLKEVQSNLGSQRYQSITLPSLKTNSGNGYKLCWKKSLGMKRPLPKQKTRKSANTATSVLCAKGKDLNATRPSPTGYLHTTRHRLSLLL